MLHLIFQSPLQTAVLERVSTGDAVIFFENAVLRLLKGSENSSRLEKMSSSCSLFVLIDEIEIRGILPEELISGIQVIDYSTFVTLSTEHKLIQTWN